MLATLRRSVTLTLTTLPFAARSFAKRSTARANRLDRFSRGTGSNRPPTANEIRPVSSLITSTTASVSWLKERAARCRMPMRNPVGSWARPSCTLSGSWHAAAVNRPLQRIMAPSCSGLRGLKTVRIKDADTWLSMISPVSMNDPKLNSR